MLAEITRMAQQGLRTLCLAYRDFPASADAASDAFDFPPEEKLTACCVVGIKVCLSFIVQCDKPTSLLHFRPRSCGLTRLFEPSHTQVTLDSFQRLIDVN